MHHLGLLLSTPTPRERLRMEGVLRSLLGNVGATISFGVGAHDFDTVALQLGVRADAVARIGKFQALARVCVNDALLPAFTLVTELHQRQLDPRIEDDITEHLLDQSRVARRRDVLDAVASRRRDLGATAPEPTMKPFPDTGFLDKWLQERHQRSSSLKAEDDFEWGRYEPVDDLEDESPGEDGRPRPRGPSDENWLPAEDDPLGPGDDPGTPPTSWGAILGAVVRLEDVGRRWREDREVLRSRAARGRLLVLTTLDGVEAVPWSHLADGDLVEGLEPVLASFTTAAWSPWTLAGWLATSRKELGGDSPIDWLREGKPTEIVLQLANRLSEDG